MNKMFIPLVLLLISFSSMAAQKFVCSNHQHSTLERVLNNQLKKGAINGARGKLVGGLYDLKQEKNCSNDTEHKIKAKFLATTKVGRVETDFECKVELSRLIKNGKPKSWTVMKSSCVEIHYGSSSSGVGSKDDHHRDNDRGYGNGPDDVPNEYDNNRYSGNYGPDSYDDGSDNYGERNSDSEFGDLYH